MTQPHSVTPAASPSARRTAVTLALCGAFFASGAAALAFETLWFRQAGLAFGNSVWASSLVLAGFMLGMALGSGLAARYGERARRPVLLFVVLELLVGLSGVALVHLLPELTGVLSPLSAALEAQPLLLNVLRFGSAFLLMVVPAAAMGMTLPVLVRGMHGWDANFGRVLGLLYGVNTLGAVFGALLTETVLVERLGVRNSGFAALGFNLLSAVLAASAAGRPAERASNDSPKADVAGSASEASVRGVGVGFLIGAFLSGFLLLGLEVVWLRCLSLFLNDTPLAFALVLVAVLSAIALGSLAAAIAATVLREPLRLAGPVALLAGLFGIATYALYGQLLQRFFVPDQDAQTVLAIAAPLVAPTAFCSGALFTLLGIGLRARSANDSRAVGRLASFNLIGSGLGSLVAGFVLLPRLGMEMSLFVLLAGYLVIGVLLMRGIVSKRVQISAAVVFVVCLAAFPFGDMRTRYIQASAGRWIAGGGGEIVSVRESVTGTLVHIVHTVRGFVRFDQLATNAYSMSVNDFAARRYMKLFVMLPVALHPKPERALIIGYGIGNTAAAVVADREWKQIDVADISADTLALSREMRSRNATKPLDDPRVRVHLEDGRHFLAGHSGGYDLITGEPPPPVIAGVVDLYTQEYFALVRSRLAPGGIASYWLPMMNLSDPAARAIIGAFCGAFSDCSLWHGSARNFMLLGTREAMGPGDAERFSQQWDDPAVRPEAEAIGFELPEQLGALFIGDASYLAELTRDTPPLVDDHPKRIQVTGTREERDALIWKWRNTREARDRFLTSTLISRLFPPAIRMKAARQFENQRVINDLLFPEKTPVRQVMVLQQLLSRTPLRFPALLILNSEPDLQAELARAPREVQVSPEWRTHRLAGLLADRDFEGAAAVIATIPDNELPLPELREYVQSMSQRAGAAPGPAGP